MADFEWYRSFVAVYQTGTVSAAARRRSLTQPAISQHLAALESGLRTPLFKRTPRRMVPTAAGRELYVRIIPAVERLEDVAGAPRAAEWRHAALRLGTPREHFHEVGLAALAGSDWDGRIAVSFGETGELLARLARDELDAVIATQRLALPGLDYTVFAREEFCIVAPARLKPPPRLRGAALEGWLRTQPWISYGPDLPLIRRYWREVYGRRPDIVPRLVIPDLLCIIRAVEAGLGISVVPRYLCRSALARNAVRLLPAPRPPVRNQLHFAYPTHKRNHASIAWLRRALGDGMAPARRRD